MSALLSSAAYDDLIGLDAVLQDEKFDTSSLRLGATAGSAIPRKLIGDWRNEHGIELRQLWGMTGDDAARTVSILKSTMQGCSGGRALACAKQAAVAGLDLRVVDEHGKELP
jgi:fatty-acyl-CoA synthase